MIFEYSLIEAFNSVNRARLSLSDTERKSVEQNDVNMVIPLYNIVNNTQNGT